MQEKMKKIIYLYVVASIGISGFAAASADHKSVESSEDSLKNSGSEAYVGHGSELSVAGENNTSPRTSRMVKYPRSPAFTLRRRQPVKLRTRADHYPIRSQIRRVQTGVLPQNGAQQIHFGYGSLKSAKYNQPAKGSYGSGGKGTSVRQQLLDVHPNGVHVPALSQQYVQSFKASPPFNGKVILHPSVGNKAPTQQKLGQQDVTYPKYIKPPPPPPPPPQASTQQHHQQQQQPSVADHSPAIPYNDFKQFPIPDEPQMQKYNEQHEKYLQQQKYLTSRDPVAYYQQQQQQLQQQQQQFQTHQHHYQQQQNYGVLQQPQYVAPKPVTQYSHPPSIPIHQISTADFPQPPSEYSPPTSTAPSPSPPKMYSVYEDSDMTELQNNNYQSASYDLLEKEAQDYLRFMNTNEYFLPKRDPNYKQQDEEHDRRQQYSLLLQLQSTQKPPTQTVVPYTQAQSYQQQQQPGQQPDDYSYQNIYSPSITSYSSQQQQQQQQHQLNQQSPQLFSPHSDSTAASSYKLSIKAPKLFYQEDPAAADAASVPSSSQGQSSTVVRTSYQTGYNSNQIVVSPQDHKTTKHLGVDQNSIVVSTQSPVSVNKVYSQVRQSPQQQPQHQPQKSRTPEPVRFEFTERDAMVGGLSYTYAPTTGHLRYKAVEPPVTPKIPTVFSSSTTATIRPSSSLSTTLRASTSYHSAGLRPVLEVDDDPEDEDDMQHAGTNLYGREPLAANVNSSNKSAYFDTTTQVSASAPSANNQKDSEEYCERICAIVEDENEEIVCGSDGYMYTSEAQMECYASCLHIDVTIQGKGSCSAR